MRGDRGQLAGGRHRIGAFRVGHDDHAERARRLASPCRSPARRWPPTDVALRIGPAQRHHRRRGRRARRARLARRRSKSAAVTARPRVRKARGARSLGGVERLGVAAAARRSDVEGAADRGGQARGWLTAPCRHLALERRRRGGRASAIMQSRWSAAGGRACRRRTSPRPASRVEHVDGDRSGPAASKSATCHPGQRSRGAGRVAADQRQVPAATFGWPSAQHLAGRPLPRPSRSPMHGLQVRRPRRC